MTPEQIIERARLVREFLDSEHFKEAWNAADADLVREFKEAASPEQAMRIYEEMRAMARLYRLWNTYLADAKIASKEKEAQEKPRKRGHF